MAQPRLIGELAVVALEAENLPKQRESQSGLKTFCVFKVAGVAKRTRTDTQGGRNPTWDDQVNMPVPHGYSQMLVQIMDEDPKRGERLICEAEVDLTKVLKEGEQDEWFPLTFQGKEAGDVYLELTFYSATPPPRRQPTRFGHQRPPQMAAAQFGRPAPMPNSYPAGPRPGVPGPPPGPPVAYSHPPNPGNFPAHAPPSTAGGYPAQPSPVPYRPGPGGPVRPAPAPGTPVAVGATWRASSPARPRPNYPPGGSPAPHTASPFPVPVQHSPGPPAGAPLLASSFRPGPRPAQESYNNGYPPAPSGGYPGNQPPYPPGNMPPGGFHVPHHPQSPYPGPPPGRPGYQQPPANPYPPQNQYRPYG